MLVPVNRWIPAIDPAYFGKMLLTTEVNNCRIAYEHISKYAGNKGINFLTHNPATWQAERVRI
jgi:hypothetical protein